ncbi:hypothetical protein NHX12_029064 [Muraenolepis orangiensis]|uniref:Uncharacterized protein n=1 Tax=Muraenolepis orangiensis TaxID=630683 RepID=A0A9Q0EEX8_9TELE|nr:hypothetical protein NHX12_029064 [Muraenolepis orangiensis]
MRICTKSSSQTIAALSSVCPLDGRTELPNRSCCNVSPMFPVHTPPPPCCQGEKATGSKEKQTSHEWNMVEVLAASLKALEAPEWQEMGMSADDRQSEARQTEVREQRAFVLEELLLAGAQGDAIGSPKMAAGQGPGWDGERRENHGSDDVLLLDGAEPETRNQSTHGRLRPVDCYVD